ncbi:hypothetical protein TRVA0_065S00188 [Trichomonascus vanleenenianus]|uniref:uncharacterized protein n=1 Tax=Trichomonascus vanleenenianus TaxID=2268995 RepID=UPI003EC9E9CA
MLEMRRSPRLASSRATRLRTSKTGVNRLTERRQVKRPIEIRNHKRKTSPCEEEFAAMVQQRRPPPPQTLAPPAIIEEPKPKLTVREVLGMEPGDPRITRPLSELKTVDIIQDPRTSEELPDIIGWDQYIPPLDITAPSKPPVFLKHTHIYMEPADQDANNCEANACKEATKKMLQKMNEFAQRSYEDDWMYE